MLQVENYNIRIVNTGDKYGRDDCLVNRKEQMIEFYDCLHSDTGRGQFVGRYYTSTILGSDYLRGLCLDGGETVSAEGMQQIMDYLREQQSQ
jgi:hypothetical protein